MPDDNGWSSQRQIGGDVPQEGKAYWVIQQWQSEVRGKAHEMVWLGLAVWTGLGWVDGGDFLLSYVTYFKPIPETELPAYLLKQKIQVDTTWRGWL